jgi:ABC transporter DrrB family efflux protein
MPSAVESRRQPVAVSPPLPAATPPSWPTQVGLLTRRVGVEAFRNPVLIINLLLALLFLVVYDGTVGGVPLLISFANGNYYNFILPAAILAASVGGGAAGLLLVADIRSGYLRRQLTMPIHRSALVTSLVLTSACQVVLQATVVVLFGVALGADPATGLGGILCVLGLAFIWGLGFAAYSVAVAVITRDVQMTSAANLIFIPLIFLSPLLVPYEYLKPWLQTAADFNPARYVTEGMRSLLIEGWDAHLLVDALAASLAFCLVMGMAAVAAIRFRSLGAGE